MGELLPNPFKITRLAMVCHRDDGKVLGWHVTPNEVVELHPNMVGMQSMNSRKVLLPNCTLTRIDMTMKCLWTA